MSTPTPDELLGQAEQMLARAETEHRDLDDAEREEYDRLLSRAERQAKVDRVRRAAEDPANRESGFGAPYFAPKRDPFEDLGQLHRADDADVRARAVTAFESVRSETMSDDQRENLVRTIERIPGAAKYALAHGSPDYVAAFVRWGQSGGTAPLYTPEEAAAVREAQAIRAALNITTGNSGQFSLPTEFDPSLIHTGNAQVNPIRQIARVVQGTQNVWNGVSVGNVTTYWHAEAAALTDGSPTLAHPVVTAGHLTAWVPASWEFFDDSPMVAQLPGLIAEAFDYAESTAFVTGSGTSQPLGLVTAISATAGSTVTATTRGSFTTNSFGDLYNVVNAVPSRYENSDSWIANKRTWNTVRQMANTSAGALFWDDLRGSVTDRPYLLGSPTYNSSDVLSTTTTGTVLAVLGDFKQYLIYDRLGTTLELVQNVVDGSGLPTGQRGLIARKRTGGNVTDLNAFRLLLM